MKFAGDIISYVAILVIIVSLGSLGMQITGHSTVTDEAIVNVTVSSSAAINFTVDLVEFGTGSVNNGTLGSTLETGQTPIGGTWSAEPAALTLENIGNVNLTLNISASEAADDYLGGKDPLFQYKVTDAASNTGACVGNGASAYKNFTTTAASAVLACNPLQFDDDKDEIDVNIKLYIPSDSVTGTHTATITATGTYS